MTKIKISKAYTSSILYTILCELPKVCKNDLIIIPNKLKN